jgi:hypothetical protein
MQFSWSITAIMGQLVAIVTFYLAETKEPNRETKQPLSWQTKPNSLYSGRQ